MSRKYYTTEDIATMYQVPVTTVRRWIRQGRIEAVDIAAGGRADYRISEAALARFDEQRSTKAAS